MSESKPLGLFGKLIAARKLIGTIPKKGFNKHHGFKFVAHDDLTLACKDAMDAVGLAFLPLSITSKACGKLTRVKIIYLLCDPETNETQEITWLGDGQDTQDKALYKAMTQCKKTIFLQLFQIATGEEEADGDYGHSYPSPKQSQAKQSPPKQSAPKPSPPKQSPIPPEPTLTAWEGLPKTEQQRIRGAFHALDSEIQWAPQYKDAKDWATKNKILTLNEQGVASLTASDHAQLNNCIDAMRKLRAARPKQEQPEQEQPSRAQLAMAATFPQPDTISFNDLGKERVAR